MVSPNQGVMAEARRFYDRAEYANALTILENFQEPDGIYSREKILLENLLLLSLAEAAAADDRPAYAKELLGRMNLSRCYCREELEKRRLCLLAGLDRKQLRTLELPGLDAELLLRAEAALEREDGDRAGRLLDAAEDRENPRWKLLRGRSHMLLKKYRPAITCLLAAEKTFPGETAPLLETCYRETDNFRRAYFYACKQKK